MTLAWLDASTRTARRSPPRSHAIFAALQRDIVLGTLPPQTVLLELHIADHFGCSQSTVREALLRLQEEGLVERQQHRGTIVSECREADAQELLRIRHDIELRGVRRSLPSYGKNLREALLEDIEAMRRAARKGDEYEQTAHDRQFHLRLFEAANLPSVQPVLTRCLLHNHRYKIHNSPPNNTLMESAERHVAIVDALDSGNLVEVRRSLSHHISTIVEFGPRVIRPFEAEEEA
ncbi:MAG: GntR family transcriptional regulator [Mesorhizobium sp.]|nr:GntR family transcriptional regulator [Mesorhizobium sp.]MBL8580377.1 GntR family transcriptional regulator [Mesorhizobium sp.]